MDGWQKNKASINKVHGFTLIELLAAAAIVGILVTLAMPRYKAFVARSRQAEASSNLGTIHRLQEAYFLKTASLGTGVYKGNLSYGYATACGATTGAEQNEIGFRLTNCAESRYLYATSSTSSNVATATNDASGLKIYPDCGQTDTWTLAHTWKLTNDDVVAKCNM